MMKINKQAEPVIRTIINDELEDIGITGKLGEKLTNVLTYALMHNNFCVPIQEEEP